MHLSFGHQREKLMVTVSLNLTSVSHGVFDRTTTKINKKLKKKIKKPQNSTRTNIQNLFLKKRKKTPPALNIHRLLCLSQY